MFSPVLYARRRPPRIRDRWRASVRDSYTTSRPEQDACKTWMVQIHNNQSKVGIAADGVHHYLNSTSRFLLSFILQQRVPFTAFVTYTLSNVPSDIYWPTLPDTATCSSNLSPLCSFFIFLCSQAVELSLLPTSRKFSNPKHSSTERFLSIPGLNSSLGSVHVSPLIQIFVSNGKEVVEKVWRCTTFHNGQDKSNTL